MTKTLNFTSTSQKKNKTSENKFVFFCFSASSKSTLIFEIFTTPRVFVVTFFITFLVTFHVIEFLRWTNFISSSFFMWMWHGTDADYLSTYHPENSGRNLILLTVIFVHKSKQEWNPLYAFLQPDLDCAIYFVQQSFITTWQRIRKTTENL